MYNDYSFYALVTGYEKKVLIEFDYSKEFKPDPKLKDFPLMISDSSKKTLAFMDSEKIFITLFILE